MAAEPRSGLAGLIDRVSSQLPYSSAAVPPMAMLVPSPLLIRASRILTFTALTFFGIITIEAALGMVGPTFQMRDAVTLIVTVIMAILLEWLFRAFTHVSQKCGKHDCGVLIKFLSLDSFGFRA